MKLRKILNELRLTEIGDSVAPPPSATYNVTEYGGKINFKLLEDDYEVDIRLPFVQNGRMTMAIDFITGAGYDMTNKNAALKVMAYVTGGIELWLQKYSKKYLNGNEADVVYIKFNAKGEDKEQGEYVTNRRNKLYQYYISKFAKKYGSSVDFDFSNGTVAKFNPSLKIK